MAIVMCWLIPRIPHGFREGLFSLKNLDPVRTKKDLQ